jgi:uncharacterized protein
VKQAEANNQVDRLIALDFVRGVAILGILLLNIVGFAWPEIVYVSPRAPTGPVSPADDWTYLAVLVFADGKFRGLFSLLFGASMLLFVERADAKGVDGASLQRRRLAWLGLFGLLHYFLIWWGDILFLYAVCGFIVLALRHWTPRQMAVRALAIYAAGAIGLGALTFGPAAPWLGLSPMPGQSAEGFVAAYAQEARAELQAVRGSWPEQVARAVRDEWSGPLLTLAISWFETVPLMLIGMALFRTGFFGGGWDRARLRRWAWVGIVGGLILTVPLAAWLWREDFPLALVLFAWLGALPFGRLASVIGYAALFVLAARRFGDTALGQRVIACGRMAFSNYIGTSLVMTFIFHGWGLGLFARYDRFELLGFVALGWVLMLAWSKQWLARFRYGPLEWLWRSLTYRELAPFRR